MSETKWIPLPPDPEYGSLEWAIQKTSSVIDAFHAASTFERLGLSATIVHAGFVRGLFRVKVEALTPAGTRLFKSFAVHEATLEADVAKGLSDALVERRGQ